MIAYVVLRLAPDWFAETKGLDAKGRADARQGVRTASLALLAGTIGVVGAVYTARSFGLNRAGQITDRFTKAIDQLGHASLDVRLGGIYALERIARDSKQDHPQVIEVLTAYVREHAPWREPARRGDLGAERSEAEDAASQERVRVRPLSEGRPAERPPTDVQAVLTVLGRRTVSHEQDEGRILDLSSTHLSRMILSEADLSGADLSRAQLAWARLDGTKLLGANLRGADLSHASLLGANLRGANLRGTKFHEARYDARTTWPERVSPEALGAQLPPRPPSRRSGEGD